MTKYQKNKLIIIVIFTSILLFIFHNYSKNGRYVGGNENKIILDTQTGKIYNYGNSKYYEIKDLERYKTDQE